MQLDERLTRYGDNLFKRWSHGPESPPGVKRKLWFEEFLIGPLPEDDYWVRWIRVKAHLASRAKL